MNVYYHIAEVKVEFIRSGSYAALEGKDGGCNWVQSDSFLNIVRL